jgi:hypothetical protein
VAVDSGPARPLTRGDTRKPPAPAHRTSGAAATEAEPLEAEADHDASGERLLRVPFAPGTGHPALLPASLAVLEESTSGIPDPLLQQVEPLAADFLDRVETGAQNPADPGYQQRWHQAQQENDQQMKAWFGTHAWMTHHVEVHRHALESTSATPRAESAR